jgi:tetratricopeptide (TPR) repeat protein
VRVDPRKRALSGAALVGLAVGIAVAADPPGSPTANESLAVCEQAGNASDPAEKRRLLARGIALGEAAVAADERDAKAHFAIFCNLGKQMRLDGIGLAALVSVRRLRREIDRTVELAPDYADALVGKGALLLDLPRLLGGDPAEGERLVRAALRIDPDFIEAHLALARALLARGARAEARAEAERALTLAERDGDRDRAREARDLVSDAAR